MLGLITLAIVAILPMIALDYNQIALAFVPTLNVVNVVMFGH